MKREEGKKHDCHPRSDLVEGRPRSIIFVRSSTPISNERRSTPQGVIVGISSLGTIAIPRRGSSSNSQLPCSRWDVPITAYDRLPYRVEGGRGGLRSPDVKR